jgi:hypothetical protein
MPENLLAKEAVAALEGSGCAVAKAVPAVLMARIQ